MRYTRTRHKRSRTPAQTRLSEFLSRPGVQVVGRDLTVTNTSAGTRKSIISGGADRGVNEVDQVTVSGLPVIGVMAGATNLVDTDISDSAEWVPSSPNIGATDQGNGIHRVSAMTSAAVLKETITTASLDRTCRVEGRLISGTITNAGAYIGFRNAGSLVGTNYELSNLTSEWKVIDCSVTSANQSTELVIRNEDETWVAEFRNVRAVDLSAPAAAFTDGSGAGEVYAVDTPTCTPIWGSAGTIVQAGVAYGWNQASHPVSQFARFFKPSNLEIWLDGNVTIVGSGGSPGVSSGGSVVDGEIFVCSGDWDSANIGVRFNELARQTAVEADIPSGTMYIGNRSDTIRPFQGWLMTIIIPWVLSQGEYDALREDILNALNEVATQ